MCLHSYTDLKGGNTRPSRGNQSLHTFLSSGVETDKIKCFPAVFPPGFMFNTMQTPPEAERLICLHFFLKKIMKRCWKFTINEQSLQGINRLFIPLWTKLTVFILWKFFSQTEFLIYWLPLKFEPEDSLRWSDLKKPTTQSLLQTSKSKTILLKTPETAVQHFFSSDLWK